MTARSVGGHGAVRVLGEVGQELRGGGVGADGGERVGLAEPGRRRRRRCAARRAASSRAAAGSAATAAAQSSAERISARGGRRGGEEGEEEKPSHGRRASAMDGG